MHFSMIRNIEMKTIKNYSGYNNQYKYKNYPILRVGSELGYLLCANDINLAIA